MANHRACDPLLLAHLKATCSPQSPQNLQDAYYEFGDLGFLTDDSDGEAVRPTGTQFIGPDSADGGILLGGQAALYGEPWASSRDPWDGP